MKVSFFIPDGPDESRCTEVIMDQELPCPPREGEGIVIYDVCGLFLERFEFPENGLYATVESVEWTLMDTEWDVFVLLKPDDADWYDKHSLVPVDQRLTPLPRPHRRMRSGNTVAEPGDAPDPKANSDLKS